MANTSADLDRRYPIQRVAARPKFRPLFLQGYFLCINQAQNDWRKRGYSPFRCAENAEV